MIWNRQKYVEYAEKHYPYPNLARIKKLRMGFHTVVTHVKAWPYKNDDIKTQCCECHGTFRRSFMRRTS